MNPWYAIRDFIMTAPVKIWRRIWGGHWVEKVESEKPKKPHVCRTPNGFDPPSWAAPGSVWECRCGDRYRVTRKVGGNIWMLER